LARALHQIDPGAYVEIVDLFSRFDQAADRGDPDAWAGTFAPDGTYERSAVRLSGREELISYLTGTRADLDGHAERGSLHVTTNAVIRVDGEWGRATSTYLLFARDGAGHAVLHDVGLYEDELVVVEGRWLLSHRTDRPIPSF
jgi:hypothetical protein